MSAAKFRGWRLFTENRALHYSYDNINHDTEVKLFLIEPIVKRYNPEESSSSLRRPFNHLGFIYYKFKNIESLLESEANQ